jgi:tRNA(Ile)-lysidine synthase
MHADARSAPRERLLAQLTVAGVSRDTAMLVGFSGGPDSVALVLWLLASGYTNLTLAHLDHGLREASAGDAAWVRDFARLKGLTAVCERSDIAALARSTGMGIEEAGREERQRFFAAQARHAACERVLLGHHADDQVETFLFRLLRGAGSRGLGGMAAHTKRTLNGFSYSLLRPMLGIWREEISAFLREQNAAFLEDASNTDPRFTRNRIRHGLLPELEKTWGRPVRPVLWRTAEMLGAEDAFLEEQAARYYAEENLRVSLVRSLHPALQRRVVLGWLRRHAVPDLSLRVVDSVLGLVHALRPSKTNVPGDAHVFRRKGNLFFSAGETGARLRAADGSSTG